MVVGEEKLIGVYYKKPVVELPSPIKEIKEFVEKRINIFGYRIEIWKFAFLAFCWYLGIVVLFYFVKKKLLSRKARGAYVGA